MKLRFSLKTLLVLLTFAALICYWQTWPSSVAAKFRETLEGGDYRFGRAMLDDSFATIHAEIDDAGSWDVASAKFQKQSIADWLAGRCRGELKVCVGHVRIEENGGMVNWSDNYSYPIEATGHRVAVVGKGVMLSLP